MFFTLHILQNNTYSLFDLYFPVATDCVVDPIGDLIDTLVDVKIPISLHTFPFLAVTLQFSSLVSATSTETPLFFEDCTNFTISSVVIPFMITIFAFFTFFPLFRCKNCQINFCYLFTHRNFIQLLIW